MKPRVVRVVTTFGVGGVQKQLTLVTPLLAERGYKVTVLALEGDGPLRATLEERGVRTAVLPMRGKYRLWEILKLARWLTGARCQILHVHRMGRVVFPAVMAGKIAGIKTIIVHHHFPYTWESRRKRILESFATRLAKVVVGVSHHVVANTTRELGVSPQKTRRLYNGVQEAALLSPPAARRELGLPQEPIVCGIVARIVYFKRIPDAVEALGILRRRRKKVVMAVVGGGEPERIASIEKRAKEAGVASHLHLCGEVKNAAVLMRAFNLGMLVSTKEGLGNTVLEYWMAGLPLVATEIPPIKEMVSAGGILVPPRSPGKIAKAIEAIASSPRLGGRLSREGKRRVKRFSVENTAETTASLYDSLSTP